MTVSLFVVHVNRFDLGLIIYLLRVGDRIPLLISLGILLIAFLIQWPLGHKYPKLGHFCKFKFMFSLCTKVRYSIHFKSDVCFHLCKNLDLYRFVPCFPASFDLLMSLGQKGLMIVLLHSWHTLGLRKVVLHSPIELLEFIFQQIMGPHLHSYCCCIQKMADMTIGFSQLLGI